MSFLGILIAVIIGMILAGLVVAIISGIFMLAIVYLPEWLGNTLIFAAICVIVSALIYYAQ